MAKNNLKRVLRLKTINPSRLARRAGLSVGLVTKILQGTGSPSPATMQKIVDALNALANTTYGVIDIFPGSAASKVAVAGSPDGDPTTDFDDDDLEEVEDEDEDEEALDGDPTTEYEDD